MTRSLKSLGLALVAVLSLTAIAASPAHAASAQFTYGAGATKVDGEQIGGPHTFISMGRTLECDAANFNATIADTKSTTLTIKPEYKDCQVTTAMGAFPATVAMNGCDLVFEGIENPGKTEAEGTWEFTMDIFCPGTSEMVISIYTSGTKTAHSGLACTIKLASWIGLTTIKATNEMDLVDDIEVDLSVTGIVALHEPEPSHKAIFCGSGVTFTAKYNGTTTLRATNAAGEFRNLTISGDA